MKQAMLPWLLAALPLALAAVPVRAQTGITKRAFGTLTDGTAVDLYTLQNTTGMTVKIMTYGAIVTNIQVPDRAGVPGDVALGFDRLEPYEKGHPFFGAIAGRVANRIAKGTFTLDGKTYTLATNNGPNHLHGGLRGFDKKVWKATPLRTDAGPALRLALVSPDGDEGYPGTLNVTVTYTLLKGRNALRIDYTATTDKATPVNLTNHSYFNLAGNGLVTEHVARFDARRYTPSDATLIPTGKIASVIGTPLDFTTPHAIGERLASIGKDPAGYDHNLVRDGQGFGRAATVTEPTTGRVLTLSTDQPGFQFYTGNFLDGTLTGTNDQVYQQYAGFCLEAQHFPDSINKPQFPTVVLRPGKTYRQRTEYAFSVVP
jgi:aldose 1-epimerase